MKIKNRIQIFDDIGVNVHDKLAVFTYYYEIEKHPLEGIYGISGAEMSPEDKYKEKVYNRIVGIYNELDNSITDVFGRIIHLESNTVTKVKIIDLDKLIEEYSK